MGAGRDKNLLREAGSEKPILVPQTCVQVLSIESPGQHSQGWQYNFLFLVCSVQSLQTRAVIFIEV